METSNYRWEWNLGKHHMFTVKSMYNDFMQAGKTPENCVLWKWRLPLKVKITFTTDNLLKRKLEGNLLNLKFDFLMYLRWGNIQNKSCRSQKVMKLCSWQPFDLKSSCQLQLYLNFSNFVNNLGWGNSQNESCRSRKVMKLCSSKRFHLKSFKASGSYFNTGRV